MKLYIIVIVIILLVLLIVFYNFNYNENFNIFNSNKIYDKQTCYINKNIIYETANNYNILNSIFIDDRKLAHENNNLKINKDYKQIGFAINPYYNFKYHIFEKYYKNNLYKYILINQNEKIDHLPPREKIFLNDIIYFKDFGYYKIIL